MLSQRTVICSAEKARRKLRLLCMFLTRCIKLIAFYASQITNLCYAFSFQIIHILRKKTKKAVRFARLSCLTHHSLT